jgi:signal peptidase II
MQLKFAYTRLAVVVAVLISLVGCDQATKQLAMARLRDGEPRTFCGDVLRLQYAENPGAFLGLGSEMPNWARRALLVAANAGVTLAILGGVALRQSVSGCSLCTWALLAAGAIGNLIDRLRHDGLVVDFLNIGIGPLRTGIFNVADMAITAAAILLIWRGFGNKASAARRLQAN